MEYKRNEIEKVIIYLTDNDNVTSAFPLTQDGRFGCMEFS